MKHEEPHKPAPRKRAPKKHIEVPVVIQPIIQAPVQQTIETPPVVTQPIPKAEEHPPVVLENASHRITIEDKVHQIEHDVEEKVNSTWGKVRSWKWLWLVIVGVCLIFVFLGYQWVNKNAEKRAEAKIEQKKDGLQAIVIKEDTTLLQLKQIEAERINEFLAYRKKYGAVVEAALKRYEYENKTMPLENEKIKQENIQDHEKINDTSNSDDDVRGNLRRQIPKAVSPR